MKKAILSILFVAGFIICASYHWLAMVAYWIILLACTIFIIDIDAWQEKKRKRAMLLAVGNYIVDGFLEAIDCVPPLFSLDDISEWFDTCILGEEEGLYRVIDNCAYGDFDMQLVADSINDLIKHGILKVVYNGGFKIGYID
jgi:hypothetical protein